jgi:hypothetical protein
VYGRDKEENLDRARYTYGPWRGYPWYVNSARACQVRRQRAAAAPVADGRLSFCILAKKKTMEKGKGGGGGGEGIGSKKGKG